MVCVHLKGTDTSSKRKEYFGGLCRACYYKKLLEKLKFEVKNND